MVLTFIETTTFTRLITDLVDDGTYSDFQKQLADHPAKGDLLPGCGGVRKIRMALPGRGESGGARICYLHLKQNDIIYLLYVFTKGDAVFIDRLDHLPQFDLDAEIVQRLQCIGR